MFSKSFSFLVAACTLLPLVHADFLIFFATSNDVTEGGTFADTELFLVNNPPSCDDISKVVPIPAGSGNGDPNDASSGGFACDGCDISKAPDDMEITRLEIYDGPDAVGSATDNPTGITTDAVGHISEYKIIATPLRFSILSLLFFNDQLYAPKQTIRAFSISNGSAWMGTVREREELATESLVDSFSSVLWGLLTHTVLRFSSATPIWFW
ncbi:hypothetical protein BJ165DRAFT_1494877 [Panaeolus papilionaceus]|nr:hypothetical protein BJ165DRAFT_1494877 [Panaeolus papilionaceus]